MYVNCDWGGFTLHAPESGNSVLLIRCSIVKKQVVHFELNSFLHQFHWHVRNATIPCRSQELLPFLPVTHIFLPPSFSLTSSCHLFLGLRLNLVVPKFIHNARLGILFPSILCTCPNQCNLFNLIVTIIVGS